jgi:phosphoglycolate phosphatase-like HAD superfamily hydrolase
MTAKAVLFDFDGVIVESFDIKTEAFRELFADEPEHLPAILKLHRTNGGLSRFAKFELIYRDILCRPLPLAEKNELGRRFADLVMEKVLACPFVPGALEFLQAYSERLPLFVASGTPHEELLDILARRGLAGYFREAHGSPPEKTEIARGILHRYSLAPSEMPFVGDSRNDYQAAVEVGLPFIGRVSPGSPDPFPQADVIHIKDLVQLETNWLQVLQQLGERT